MNERLVLAFTGLAKKSVEEFMRGPVYLPERTKGYTKATLKTLSDYGLIYVWTIREMPWGNAPGLDKNTYKIVITDKGWKVWSGEVDVVEKRCTLDQKWPDHWSICKRHGIRHERPLKLS